MTRSLTSRECAVAWSDLSQFGVVVECGEEGCLKPGHEAPVAVRGYRLEDIPGELLHQILEAYPRLSLGVR